MRRSTLATHGKTEAGQNIQAFARHQAIQAKQKSTPDMINFIFLFGTSRVLCRAEQEKLSLLCNVSLQPILT
jgi:hypothetical protein